MTGGLHSVEGGLPHEHRRLLSLAVDKIVLRSEGNRLVAEFCGNLGGVLSLEPDLLGCIGAGRGILFERRASVRIA